MPITHYAFRSLPLDLQLSLVWQQGTFLARRWDEDVFKLPFPRT
jgi:hypothetical protein